MDDFEKCLYNFFNLVSQLCFDKSRELIDKEKDLSRPGHIKLFLVQLSSYVEAERSYFNLGFFSTKNKMFLRKEISLKSMYDSIRTEVHKLEESTADSILNLLVSQFCHYLAARRDLITVYEQLLYAGTSGKHVKYEDLLNLVKSQIDKNKNLFTHQALTGIKNLYNWESEILENIFKAQVAIQKWILVESIMPLQAANTILTQWDKQLQCKETWKLGFLKATQSPHLYQWLVRLKGSIVNKFTFYFYHCLAQQTSSQDMKNHLSTKHNTDFILKFHNLQKKFFASSLLLLFDPKGLTDWMGPGYHHPDRAQEIFDQHIVMNGYPMLKINERLPAISKVLSERNTSAMDPEKVVSYYDSQAKCTYFMCNIDPRVTLLALFDNKKEDRDSNINTLMVDFCSQVTFSRLYAALKLTK